MVLMRYLIQMHGNIYPPDSQNAFQIYCDSPGRGLLTMAALSGHPPCFQILPSKTIKRRRVETHESGVRVLENVGSMREVSAPQLLDEMRTYR